MSEGIRVGIVVTSFMLLGKLSLLANGGAWPTGVPSTGNGAPSDKNRSTAVAIEDENLTIDLHQEFAAVEVRYRLRNTGGKITQDFFFPVERWAEDGDSGPNGDREKPPDLEGYSIRADNTELKWKTIDVPVPKKEKEEPTPEETPEPQTTPTEAEGETENDKEYDPDAEVELHPYQPPSDLPPPTKHWKKSEIPFAANQAREVIIRYRVPDDAYAPCLSSTGRVAFIAVSDLERSIEENSAAIAQVSDRPRLVRTIEKARREAEFVIALVHWGEENSAIVTDRQRELARRLISHGIDLIAGSHPHCIQPLDFYRGRPIVYSLGNLVFDRAPTVTSWNKGQLLKVGIGDSRRASPSLELVPIRLDGRGFPQLLPAAEMALR